MCQRGWSEGKPVDWSCGLGVEQGGRMVAGLVECLRGVEDRKMEMETGRREGRRKGGKMED
jgi:hypothetical protein